MRWTCTSPMAHGSGCRQHPRRVGEGVTATASSHAREQAALATKQGRRAAARGWRSTGVVRTCAPLGAAAVAGRAEHARLAGPLSRARGRGAGESERGRWRRSDGALVAVAVRVRVLCAHPLIAVVFRVRDGVREGGRGPAAVRAGRGRGRHHTSVALLPHHFRHLRLRHAGHGEVAVRRGSCARKVR